MFNFKKIKGTVNKATSAILTASLSLGIFSVAPVKAMESYSEDTTVVENEEVDREECWDPYTMLSNAEFILGDNHKDQIKELKEEFEKDRNAKFIQEYDIKNDDDGKKDCKEKSVEVTNQYKEDRAYIYVFS